MQTVIETKSLCKQYGTRMAVDHVELHVPQGCVYGFIGPNGAGKSTTMKMLLGLIHPTSGSVRLLGQPLTRESRLALLRQTGSLIENPAGYLHLTAQENLEIVADLKGVPHKDIDRVLDIVHLAQDRSRKVGQYSLGMKQRLGIAMALLGSPKLLILDEPTNGLDPAGIQEMRALIDHGHMLFEGPLAELQRHSRGSVMLRLLDPTKAAPILRAHGIAADGGCVTLPPLRDDLLAVLVQQLAMNGAGVVELTPHTKTLEEIFLSLTSEEAD